MADQSREVELARALVVLAESEESSAALQDKIGHPSVAQADRNRAADLRDAAALLRSLDQARRQVCEELAEEIEEAVRSTRSTARALESEAEDGGYERGRADAAGMREVSRGMERAATLCREKAEEVDGG